MGGVLGMKLYDLERQKDAMQANKDEMKIEYERQIEEFIKKMKDNEINLIHSNDERAQAQKKMVMELQQIHKKKQDELKKEMNDIQDKYQKIANLSTTLQHQMNDLKEEKKTMQITIDALVSHVQQNEKLEKNIDAMKVKYKALKQNGDKMEVGYVQQIECLAMQSKENENLITTLNQSVSALKSECNQLRVDKDKMEAEHERQLQHIEELVKKLENHDLKHANDANLQKKMNEKDEAMGVLGMKLYELERQKDAMQKTMDRLIEQKKAMEQNVNTLASDNKVSKENAVEYERQIAELMKELKHANDERNKITKENVDFSDKLQATVSNAMNGKIDLFMDEFRKEVVPEIQAVFEHLSLNKTENSSTSYIGDVDDEKAGSNRNELVLENNRLKAEIDVLQQEKSKHDEVLRSAATSKVHQVVRLQNLLDHMRDDNRMLQYQLTKYQQKFVEIRENQQNNFVNKFWGYLGGNNTSNHVST